MTLSTDLNSVDCRERRTHAT